MEEAILPYKLSTSFSYLLLTQTQLSMITQSHSVHTRHRVRKPPVTTLGMDTMYQTMKVCQQPGVQPGQKHKHRCLVYNLHAVLLGMEWKEKLVPAFCITAYWQKDSCRRRDIYVNRSSLGSNGFEATFHMRLFYLPEYRGVWTGECFTVTLKAKYQCSQECKGLQVERRGGNKWAYMSVAYLLELWGIRLGLCSYFLNSLCILS